MKKRHYILLVLTMTLILGGVAAGVELREQPLVNLFLFDTGIKDALMEITMQTGINIIADSTVSGLVTADLQDVPLEQALRIILIGGGFTFRKIDDFYLVGLPDPRSSTFGELADTRIVVLKNITAERALALLPSFLSGYVKGERGGKMLIVTAPPSELVRILELIEAVDEPQKQVEIRVVVSEVSAKALKELGTNLFQLAVTPGEESSGSWAGVLNLQNNLHLLETNALGNLLLNLKAMEENQEAKIYADPRVLVSDGQPAQLFVGDRQILLLSDFGEKTTRVERIEVGMNLKVTPEICGDEILLSIAPEMSHLVSESRNNLVVKQSSVATTIKLKDGQTAVLAGMGLQETGEHSKRVPVLGSIPLLRWLFRTDAQRTGEKELLIFVTPSIKRWEE